MRDTKLNFFIDREGNWFVHYKNCGIGCKFLVKDDFKVFLDRSIFYERYFNKNRQLNEVIIEFRSRGFSINSSKGEMKYLGINRNFSLNYYFSDVSKTFKFFNWWWPIVLCGLPRIFYVRQIVTYREEIYQKYVDDDF